MPASASLPNLLIVDDEESLRDLLVSASQSRGWRPVTASSGDEACRLINSDIMAVVLDHLLPDGDGIQMLELLRRICPDVPVIMLTGLNDAETAVRALRAGADDYLTKPFELERLFGVIQEACRSRRQSSSAEVIRDGGIALRSDEVFENARSPSMHGLYKQMKKAAQLDVTLLLTGESGTGKTFIAREIHRLSQRAAAPFIPVSCPALPRELLESELFGHERGAFTGATALREGRFEQASMGTIFLDEIGDLPNALQPKLLTVLQDQEFFRVGGNRMLRTNARIIAATNIDLRARVSEGRFREDLYYRLDVLQLRLPPLRERLEDLPDLIRSILDRIARKRGKESWTITAAAVQLLKCQPWPGNIRQLENVLERATAFTDTAELDERDILPLCESRSGTPTAPTTAVRSLGEVAREAFADAYQRCGNNKARTARELGVAERTVYNLLARYAVK
ncbi:MAG: sigma-54-dependent Fis family transcriptional regulator [Verrucomicrobia bacterium]|nr:MAG: sigma-54-dependent Fis family transcriptional regulator [Verrucomicrobiota bacterium]